MPVDPLIARTVALPISIDLGATFLFSITGAMVAIRRHYDAIGVFVLALACGLGGGLLRDGLFIQAGPPAAMRNGSYMIAVIVGCVVHPLFLPHVIERLSKPFLIMDALGTSAYGVVGASIALEAGLAVPACIFVGVVNAVGSGLVRDVLVREEPLMLKPGQFYAIASLLGVAGFTLLVVYLRAPVVPSAIWRLQLLLSFVSWRSYSIGRPDRSSLHRDPKSCPSDNS